jgi:hypothetical protein
MTLDLRTLTRAACVVAAFASLAAGRAIAQAPPIPAEYQKVLAALDRAGDFAGGVLKVNLPRADLAVSIKGRPVPTPLGFGGWVAFAKGTGPDADHHVLMGDLVLTEDEVNGVMSALLARGFDVTALHNHFFWEQPRIFYMHVHGHGTLDDLVARLRPAVASVGRGPAAVPAAAAAPQGPPLDTAALAAVVGARGEQTGAVYKITIGRADVKVTEMGAEIGARMGLNTWAAFTGTAEDAVVAGDVAMLASEVSPVLKALRTQGIDVVSIHHHMVGTEPAIYFLHYWGQGPAEKLARGVRAALDVLGDASTRSAKE